MFAQTFVDTRVSARKPATIIASVGMQALAVCALLLIPLLHPEVLIPKIETPVYVPLHIVTLPPPVQHTTAAAAHASTAPRVFTAPAKIPATIAKIVDVMDTAPEAPGVYIPGAAAIGNVMSDIVGVPLSLPEKPPAPKPAVQPKPATAAPMHVSSGVQSAKLLFGPKPAYPPLARTARQQGTVKL